MCGLVTNINFKSAKFQRLDSVMALWSIIQIKFRLVNVKKWLSRTLTDEMTWESTIRLNRVCKTWFRYEKHDKTII